MKYGRLTIQGEAFRKLASKKSKQERTYIKAICDCGTTGIFQLYQLKKGHTKSCGCISKESWIELNVIHNLSKHPLYSIWFGMKSRCYNPSSKHYHNYGGRGIVVCDEWLNDFMTFYNWAIVNWQKGLTIDREKNNGNYEPSNCRFVPQKINNRNTRRTKLNPIKVGVIRNTYNIGAFTQEELASIYNISRRTVRDIIGNKTWI